MLRFTIVACLVAVAFGASSDASGSGSSGSEGGSDKKGAIKVSVHKLPVPTCAPRTVPNTSATSVLRPRNTLCESSNVHTRTPPHTLIQSLSQDLDDALKAIDSSLKKLVGAGYTWSFESQAQEQEVSQRLMGIRGAIDHLQKERMQRTWMKGAPPAPMMMMTPPGYAPPYGTAPPGAYPVAGAPVAYAAAPVMMTGQPVPSGGPPGSFPMAPMVLAPRFKKKASHLRA